MQKLQPTRTRARARLTTDSRRKANDCYYNCYCNYRPSAHAPHTSTRYAACL